jgi:hypothetical protein
MRECAVEFGVTRSWLSVIVNSQAFRDRMAKRADEIFDEVVVPLRDKMAGVAHRAYEKLADKVEVQEDPKLLLEIADRTAHRLGYAPNRGPEPAAPPALALQQNFFVDKETLAHARGEIIDMAKDQDALPAPEKLPTS